MSNAASKSATQNAFNFILGFRKTCTFAYVVTCNMCMFVCVCMRNCLLQRERYNDSQKALVILKYRQQGRHNCFLLTNANTDFN